MTRRDPLFHLLLLAVTFLTTTIFGAFFAGNDPTDPSRWPSGLVFSLPLLAILGAHEMAHYLAARRHGVAATLPYFIPSPVGPGTFGAIIKLTSPVPNRKALLALGLSGPATSFLLSLAALLFGIPLSSVVPLEEAGEGLYFGTPLVMEAMVWLLKGSIPEGSALGIHPLAFAGWIGLLVTSLNLLPIGQLDGGHIVYALAGRGHRFAARIAFAVLIPLGFIAWWGWWLWAAIALFIGLDHPPCVDDTPLHRRSWIFWLITGAIFVLSFILAPVTLPPAP